jgi:hypothetical protein
MANDNLHCNAYQADVKKYRLETWGGSDMFESIKLEAAKGRERK